MCGVTGFLRPDGLSTTAREELERMVQHLVHRGPDGAGTWIDPEAGIALGHRRLSILDLSEAGSQPMVSHSGRYVLVTNGEIYNHLDLRAELNGSGHEIAWRGHSDTETMVAAFDRWGVEGTLVRLVGMFAFALWDRQERVLTLARDRMGEKPLYYGWQQGTLLFGSELKSLRVHSAFRADIDRNSISIFAARGYIPAPRSIYRGILKLVPGACMQFTSRIATPHMPEPRTYWSLQGVVERGLCQSFEGSDEDAICQLEAGLKRAVSMQCIADVPLGAFLSGGIDSSTIVALMQAQASRPVKTFTIGFKEAGYQEAGHAKAVAHHLGTDHTELYVTPREAMEVIPGLPAMYDEPFGDSSAIPTYLVSKLARRQVIVSLSGDGGDELFGGYSRYRRSDKIWRAMRPVPRGARNAVSRVLRAFSQRGPDSRLGWKAYRLSSYLSARTFDECYQVQVVQAREADFVVGNVGAPHHAGVALENAPLIRRSYDRMMYTDAKTYLPDSILVKVDRASMAASLESRVPMLDHRVVEFAWHLPFRMKVRDRQSKWVLRQVLKRYVPTVLTDRQKMGFRMPVGVWLRGPLREWAESLLSENRLKQEGFLNVEAVRRQWFRHLARRSFEGDAVWQVLMFQAWLASTHP